MSDLEDRLTTLESRLAHHERIADDLSEVLARQDRTIDLLTAQIRRLLERQQFLETSLSRVPDAERPPHY